MKYGRNTAGKFTSGNSGRPKGARNKKTLAIDSLLEGQAEALTQTAISKALDGDGMALKLCMERIAPAPKDNTVSFTLAHMNNVSDASQAAGSVLTAVSNGNLTPIEATRVMGLIDSYRRTLAKQLGFSAVYVWITSVGAKMGDHLHMALHWRYSSFLDLVNLLQQILGSDVDHEAELNRRHIARSCCRGWEIKEIIGGLSGAFRWGRYMASQQFKHQDSSGGRRMGTSLYKDTGKVFVN